MSIAVQKGKNELYEKPCGSEFLKVSEYSSNYARCSVMKDGKDSSKRGAPKRRRDFLLIYLFTYSIYIYTVLNDQFNLNCVANDFMFMFASAIKTGSFTRNRYY